jgi:hypothetical protein
MSLFKDELTAQLDDVTRAASESLEFYADLAPQLESTELARLLDAQCAAQRRLLERIAAYRRNRGEPPEVGDPERSYLGAAAAHLRAHVLPGSPAVRYAESILDAAAKLGIEIDEALGAGPDSPLRAMLEAFKRENGDFERQVRAGAGIEARP